MALSIHELAEKIFSTLKGNGLKIKIFNSDGMETVDPQQGVRFFVLKPNIMVTIGTDADVVQFNKGSEVKDSILPIQKSIRAIADEFQYNFEIKVFGRTIQPKDYAYQAKTMKKETMYEGAGSNSLLQAKLFRELDYVAGMSAEALTASIPGADRNDVQLALNALEKAGKVEVTAYIRNQPVYSKVVVRPSVTQGIAEGFSKMFGSLKTSRQVLENVKIIIKHKKAVDESVKGSRTRQISAIFLECNGERFRLQYNYLPAARAMAQHLAHGGHVVDTVGSYITETTGNLLKLQSFGKYVSANRLINEDTSGIIETVYENIQIMKDDIRKIAGSKTYESIKSRVESLSTQQLDETETANLRDMFTVRRFDERFNEVLPIIQKMIQEKTAYHARIEEAASKTVKVSSLSDESTPILEFTSDNAKLGYKINKLASRILENEELAKFVSSVGYKVTKNTPINCFEKSIVLQVLENAKISKNINKNRPTELVETIKYAQFVKNLEECPLLKK